jgi:putative FmdB family regulatory protein
MDALLPLRGNNTMPTYEYKCKNCGHTFEEFQSMSAASLVECPVCKTPNLQRIIGNGAGMIFKGSGFYETDYKKTSAATGAKSKATEKKETTPPPKKPSEPTPPKE